MRVVLFCERRVRTDRGYIALVYCKGASAIVIACDNKMVPFEDQRGPWLDFLEGNVTETGEWLIETSLEQWPLQEVDQKPYLQHYEDEKQKAIEALTLLVVSKIKESPLAQNYDSPGGTVFENNFITVELIYKDEWVKNIPREVSIRLDGIIEKAVVKLTDEDIKQGVAQLCEEAVKQHIRILVPWGNAAIFAPGTPWTRLTKELFKVQIKDSADGQ